MLMTLGKHHSTFAISPTGMLLSTTVSLTNLEIQDQEIMIVNRQQKSCFLQL
jgi:hypothetical protein